MKENLTIALAGNPNSGKTTIYNALTGARQHIGNYPGVTVEKKESTITYNNQQLKIIDLPGTYSLTAYSVEEVVARNVIINEKPDVVVDIIDSSNLERNLYLAVQLMELRIPLVFVFNMKDMAQEMGIKVDIKSLSNLFGVPIVETVGSKGDGVKNILDEAIKAAQVPEIKYPVITYDKVIEKYVNSVEELIKQHSTNIENYNTRWLAVKLLEGDKDVMQVVPSPIVAEEVKRAEIDINKMLGDSPETAIASARYGFISGACQECVTTTVEARHNMSDAIDSVLVNRVLGIPIFLGLMYLVFQLTFTLGDPFMGWIEQFFGFLGDKASALISHDLLRSLIVDGIIGGVGGVIVFLPNIIFLFIAIAILEASGYMARVAFIMDKVMHKIGLHGKSFIPFLIGFGCSVPAIMATRTLDNQRDRILTMLVTPFMSCGARLPIYLLIIPAFFDKNQALVLWIVYLIGIVMAIVIAKILGMTVLKGESAPFVMELPPYRIPTLKGVLMQMWERSWLYLKKAGTIILLSTIIIWFTTYFGFVDGRFTMLSEDQIGSSILAMIGNAIAWIFAPLGWGNWQAAVASITGLVAKENIVGTLGILYGGTGTVYENMSAAFTTVIGYSFLAFNLLCAPCFAAIGAIKREMNNGKWTLFAVGYQCAFAYAVALVINQIGSIFIGQANVIGIIASVLVIAFIVFMLVKPYKEPTRLKAKTAV